MFIHKHIRANNNNNNHGNAFAPLSNAGATYWYLTGTQKPGKQRGLCDILLPGAK
jgi:hypothetical protein